MHFGLEFPRPGFTLHVLFLARFNLGQGDRVALCIGWEIVLRLWLLVFILRGVLVRIRCVIGVRFETRLRQFVLVE